MVRRQDLQNGKIYLMRTSRALCVRNEQHLKCMAKDNVAPDTAAQRFYIDQGLIK